jgi:predicted trehalose synthase
VRFARSDEEGGWVAGVFGFAGADGFQHGDVAMLLAELAEQGSLGLSEDAQTAVENLFDRVERRRVSASSASY